MYLSRRRFMQSQALLAAGWCLGGRSVFAAPEAGGAVRRYNASLSVVALEQDPELLPTIKEAGVEAIWLSCFFQGSWNRSLEDLIHWREKAQALGIATRHITIPLGHPTFSETPPNYMPQDIAQRWAKGQRPDGRGYYGVSLHPPITEENVTALKQIVTTSPGTIFVDDDFRLAPSPDDIGGCFCAAHRAQFLSKHGWGDKEWAELLAAVEQRESTPIVRQWLTDACDELTASFRAQQAALAGTDTSLGIMVMFMGSEKAGIRLTDYAGVPFRVGELMFDDRSFAPVKGKTNELFSSLFHRRFVTPELAYSETTAWPADGLSAANMAAKLVVSTISDVRNTMFMSGLIPFPRTHWAVLGPAMRHNAEMHRQLAGHRPQGPFKHFWGEDSRWVGDSNAYSLFLALGIPFEVIEEPSAEGWMFLSRADARAVAAGRVTSRGAALVCRPGDVSDAGSMRAIPEEMSALYAFKREILPTLTVPHVVEETPVVCAWYPTAQKVLLWNCTEEKQTITLKHGAAQQTLTLDALGADVVSDMRQG